MSDVKCFEDLIPGAEYWPKFVQNKSEHLRLAFLSLLWSHPLQFCLRHGGSFMPIVVSHGEEGRVLRMSRFFEPER